MSKRSKRYNENMGKAEENKMYDLADALTIIQESSNPKFDETIDISLNLNIDPSQSDQSVRGMINLPNGIGKDIRVAVFAKGEKIDEAKSAGADIVGSEELIEEISSGKIDFDRCISTPEMMPTVGKLGQVLGPKGLMPNPKLGTVTNDVKSAVELAKSGSVEFRAEKSGIVHAGIGKVSFSKDALRQNILEFVNAVKKEKPNTAKGSFLKKVSLSSSMGVGLNIDTGAFY
ncbi:MAG: 50S ribosomal protein L1 [Rhodobiaceae bacterium]|jgi:large subunit ribosomal protein L1|nr:50S ribosomal protein L1 [Rhodobiaceae bacterium]